MALVLGVVLLQLSPTTGVQLLGAAGYLVGSHGMQAYHHGNQSPLVVGVPEMEGPVPEGGDKHDREQSRRPKPTRVPSILIATPVMNSTQFLPNYWARIRNLTYPHAAISIAFLDDDESRNGDTWRR
jgi:hypothetical protein